MRWAGRDIDEFLDRIDPLPCQPGDNKRGCKSKEITDEDVKIQVGIWRGDHVRKSPRKLPVRRPDAGGAFKQFVAPTELFDDLLLEEPQTAVADAAVGKGAARTTRTSRTRAATNGRGAGRSGGGRRRQYHRGKRLSRRRRCP